MAATGCRVVCKRGGFFDFKSGNLIEDKEGAEQLKEQLGDGATMTPLGGAEAYAFPIQLTFDGMGSVMIWTPDQLPVVRKMTVIFFERIAQMRKEGHRFTCDFE